MQLSNKVIYNKTSMYKYIISQYVVSLLPPLVSVQEIDRLQVQLSQVVQGKRFLLQGGDCAETFRDCNPILIEKKLRIMLQMSLVYVLILIII